MTIQFECDCGEEYRVSDANAGRNFRCKQCGDTLSVPEPQRKKAARKKKAARRSDSSQQSGVRRRPDSGARRRPDARQQPRPKRRPRNDYDEHDDSYDDPYDDYSDEGYSSYDEAPRGDSYQAPSRQRRKKKKKKKKSNQRRYKDDASGSNVLFLVGVLVVVPIVLSIVMSVIILNGGPDAPKNLALVAGVPSVLSLIGGIGCLIKAFEEDLITGVMYLFVPFFGLYFILTHLDDCLTPFCFSISGLLTYAMTAAMINVFG